MCGTLDNMELRQNYPLFCRKNTLYQISFYPHERTVTPRYLSLSITDSVTSHQPPWSFGFDSQTRAPPPRSLVRDGRTSPHRLRLVVFRSTCPPLSPAPTREQLCNTRPPQHCQCARGVRTRESLLGPSSQLMVARPHKHALCAHTHR